MTVEVDILLTLLGMVATAAAIWGGIRADLRSMRREIERTEAAAGEAHHRIDRLYRDLSRKGLATETEQ